jgi:alpha-glucosidase
MIRRMAGEGVPWWQRGAIYQIYPRSFADSDGDGIGDLTGIIEHLDHVAALGAVAIWLSPIYRSPMADFGYDISDYCDVDPVFGTLADLDALVSSAHARGLRVVLDWVPNHTSDLHPWFEASRASRDGPRRGWYVWRDGTPDGEPPNDWRSQFAAAGPAWRRDARTDQWYLHSFTPEQPDLNWDNPEVEAAMHDVIRFWLARGIDGLRLDAIHKIAKDPELRDNAGAARRHDEDWDTIHDRLRGIRRVVEEFEDRMVVGEVAIEELRRTVSYLAGGDQLHLAHNFVFPKLPWHAPTLRASIDEFEHLAEPGAWPAWFFENHDLPRVATHLGPRRARAAALILYALRGTPFIYQGQELGLPDASIPPDRVVDVDGRDPVRAPMPWRAPSSAGPGAGFSTAEPWLPVVAEAESLCVERQAGDPRSMLALVRALGRMRAERPELQVGSQRMVDAGPDVLAWTRGDSLLAAVNFASRDTPLAARAGATVLVSSDADRSAGSAWDGRLGPDEAVVLDLARA